LLSDLAKHSRVGAVVVSNSLTFETLAPAKGLNGSIGLRVDRKAAIFLMFRRDSHPSQSTFVLIGALSFVVGGG
jgi:hypothetical protein